MGQMQADAAEEAAQGRMPSRADNQKVIVTRGCLVGD